MTKRQAMKALPAAIRKASEKMREAAQAREDKRKLERIIAK